MALEGRRGWVLEQLAGVGNLQSVSPATQQSVARYLATLAFFELDTSVVSLHIQCCVAPYLHKT